jgi:type I restriction enzyme S subunit
MLNSEVFSGDVLLNITGASIGRCYYVDKSLGKANVNQHVCIVRPNKKIEAEFLYSILASEIGQLQVFDRQLGANREGLNFEELKQFIIPYPPESERNAITTFIRKETSHIDTIITKTKKEIELLQEYRTSLISEVVTGKIDVRAWKEPE